jgi:hypothetical protein
MKVRLPAPVAAIYRAVEELEAAYPGRKVHAGRTPCRGERPGVRSEVQ